MTVTTFEPIKTQNRDDSTQRFYRFDNHFGASVLRARGTYGYDRGLWELIVIAWHGGQWRIIRGTPVTAPDTILGWLDEAAVQAALAEIAALPAPSTELAVPHAPVEVMTPSAGDPETPDIEHVCQVCWTLWPCPPAWLADLPGARPEPIDWAADSGLYAEEAPF